MMDQSYTDEYILPPCPECGHDMEYVNDLARGYGMIRCMHCSWSQIASVMIVDDDWLFLGSYSLPAPLPGWRPYLPNDERRKGLADWQITRPTYIKKQDMTLNSQRLYVLETLGYLADTLTPLTLVLSDEPYLLNKMEKIEHHLRSMLDLLPPVPKITPFMASESRYRMNLYCDMLESFCPIDILIKSRTEPLTAEEARPYAWGWLALSYWWWWETWNCEMNCAEVLETKGVRRHWTAMKASLEALCSRYGAEQLFYRLATPVKALRDKKYGVKKHGKKKKRKAA